MKATIFYSIEKYFSTLLIAGFGFLLANKLSEKDFGMFASAEAIVAIFSIFALQGIDQLVQREVVKDNYSEDKIFSTCFFIKIIGISVCLSLFFVFYTISKQNIELLVITSILMLNNTFRALHFVSAKLVCNNKYTVFMLIGVVSAVMSLGVKLYFLLFFDEKYLIAISMVLESFLLLVFYIIYWFNTGLKKIDFDLNLFYMLVKEGKYLILSGAIVLLYTKIDILMIDYFLSDEDVANYSLANKIVMLYLMLSTVLTLSYVSKLKLGDESYIYTCRKMLIAGLSFGAFMAVINAILSAPIIAYFFPDKYIDAREYVLFQSLIIFFAFTLATTGRILVTEQMTRIGFERNLLALVANVAMNYMMIPKYGVYGAIYASAISYMISSFLYLLIRQESRLMLLKIIFGKVK